MIMISSREINLRSSALINWFSIQTCCVQWTLVITMQCWKRKTSWRAFKSIHFENAMNKDFWLGEFTTTSGIETCYHNFSSSMRNEWNWKCDCALDEPRIVCIVPGFHHVKLKNRRSCLSCFWFPLFLMPKFHLFIKGMNNDKLIITQRVHPPSLNMHTEGDVGTWDISYF